MAAVWSGSGACCKPKACCLPCQTARIIHGQPIACTAQVGVLARAYNATGEFFAILRLDPTKNVWRPLKVLA